MKTLTRIDRLLKLMAWASVFAFGYGAAAAADYATTLSGLNPAGYWKLNEAATPYSSGVLTNSGSIGDAGNGTFYFGPVLQDEGALGPGNDTALNLNGSSQYAEVPYAPQLNPTGPFTVEFWAKITNDTAGAKSGVVSRYIPVTGGPAGQRGYLFFANNGNTTWQFRVYNGTNASTTVTSATTTDLLQDTWYHVVGVYDGSQIHIYVNGEVTSSASTTVPYFANTNTPLRIGAGTTETGPSLYFPGVIDEVAIYQSVLSADTIAAHYSAASTNAAGYATQILASTPVAFWRLNEPVLPPIPTAANSGSLGSDYNGAYTYGVTSGVTGARQPQFFGMTSDNNSVELNGTSAMVNIPALSPINNDHITLTCWLKRDGSQPSFAGIMFTRPGTGASGLSFDGANQLSYTWNNAANTYNFNSHLLVPDGIWTFAALVVTPTNAILYCGSTNGLRSATNNVAHTAHDFSTSFLRLGYDQGARYLKGRIDDAAIFDTALDYDSISNLFYSATPAIPLVTRTPADPLYEGMTIQFAAYGVGNGPVSYQWRKGGNNLSGKTDSTLTLSNIDLNASGNYDVAVTVGANTAISETLPILVSQGPPVVFSQSPPLTRFAGARVTFSVDAGGSAPLSYQWQKNSTDIPGATGTSYTIPAITAGDMTDYRVKLVNPYGTNYSTQTALTVLPVNNYAAAVMAGSPVAYWRLNETSGTKAFDYAGGNDGTTQGPVVLGAVGPRPPTQLGLEADNNSFTFDGSTAWVTGPALNWNTNTMTLTAMIKVNAYHPTDLAGILFSRGTAASGMHMISSGELRYHWSSASHYSFASGLFVPIGQWVFVALVVEPTRATLYMNDGSGLVSSVHNDTHPVTSGSDPIYVGRDRTDRVFNGDIDEAAVYTRALSSDEIQNLSLMAVSGPTPPAIVSEPSSQNVIVGQSAAFTVGAVGAVPLSYQWNHNGSPVPGGTSKSLSLANVYYSDAGTYTVGITNAQGGTNSGAAILSVAAIPTFANLTNDLILHLAFDNDVQDSSGHGNHGTIVGETNFVAGKLGNALHYNTDTALGVYNYVTLGSPADLAFGDTNFSVAYWVKFTGAPGDLPFFGSGAGSYGSFGLTFAPSYNAGGWSYWLGGDTGSAGLYGAASSLNDGNWHSLVHTFNRTGNAVTYLDGVQVDSRSIANVGNVDSGLSFSIGQDPTGSYGETGDADIDDLGVWRRVLSSVEAQAVYLAGQNGRSFNTYGPVLITLQAAGNSLEIIWEAGTLEAADEVAGPYETVAGASAPYHKVTTSGQGKFYRIRL